MTLISGSPIPYWQVTDLEQARYDVAESPMEGEMDSTFFLTKDKNFIPHTYPCRTAYIAQVRDVEPAPRPMPDWSVARNIMPAGSPFLDLSGFWFRATRIHGWARTAVTAAQAGPARLKLGICGAGVVYVNGLRVAWLAPASRNAMAEVEFTAELVAGHNEIAIQFEDLCERDAVIRVALTWHDGPPASASHCFSAKSALVTEVEAALEAMHLDRKLYDGEDIWLILPRAFPRAVTGMVHVAGHFMSHDHNDIAISVPAGADRVRLCASTDLPADFRYFDFNINCGGFVTQARLGAEISWRHKTKSASAQISDRIAETLVWLARHAETDTETALACVAVGDMQALTRAEQIITTALPGIEECFDCADFALVPLLWARMVYGDRLSQALVARIDAATLAFRYWMDEPGNDVQWYFSENHALLFHTAAYLAGHMHPNATFRRSGRVGTAQSRAGYERLVSWFDHFESAEMAEFNSATYFPIDFKGLTALYALAPDAAIQQRAYKAIVRLVTMVAHSAHHGVITAAQGRSYEHSLCVSDTSELTGLSRLIWGKGTFGAHANCLAQIALCLRDYKLQLPDLAAIANWEDADHAQEWTFWQGNNAFARLYHYKTCDTAMGSVASYRWGDWGYQETLLQARIGRNPAAQIWINHPGEIVQSGFGRPSFWGGSASVPRVQQYRDLAIVAFNGQAPQPGFTHAWFPTQSFDEWSVDGTRAIARSGNGAMVIAAGAPLVLTKSGGSADHELRLPGYDGLWIVRLGQTSDLGGFAQFHAVPVTKDVDGTITVTDADYGPVVFHTDGTIAAEGRILDPMAWSLRGQRTKLPL
ncbi:hypothetical protein BFP70_03475 [Thioclava sp. SK-1]|uniref:hypothetical protein n=1 Tax=Thioclava sp. SK-1 TaxID=1889770 RepID=UPI000824862B|nr:hypothetical protein [Thioclava sp. SK-1]OCX66900.1 hypothetical protein BFP70_03475 [Thioclava sp. SK-1]